MKEFKEVAHHYLKSGLMFRGRFKGWAHFSNGDMTLCPIDLSNDRFDEMKPIMYDMIDIDKEITHNGETFIPMRVLMEGNGFDLSKLPESEIQTYYSTFKEPLFLNLHDVMQLIEWNFNVFGIESTINKMTYES